ncbi:unnamed protein product [Moneuplotes crassus]|uniref:Uncharacterized protein n=1 Tax=Euplotes crassus TaxID=5936 RepID=A0AAD1YAF3_EUPCR|nr:unnamed protein product [Moneuplotes crassus]
MQNPSKIRFGSKRDLSPTKPEKILIKMTNNPFQARNKPKGRHRGSKRNRSDKNDRNSSPQRIDLIGAGVKYFDKTRCEQLNCDLKTVRDPMKISTSKLKLTPTYDNVRKPPVVETQKAAEMKNVCGKDFKIKDMGFKENSNLNRKEKFNKIIILSNRKSDTAVKDKMESIEEISIRDADNSNFKSIDRTSEKASANSTTEMKSSHVFHPIETSQSEEKIRFINEYINWQTNERKNSGPAINIPTGRAQDNADLIGETVLKQKQSIPLKASPAKISKIDAISWNFKESFNSSMPIPCFLNTRSGKSLLNKVPHKTMRDTSPRKLIPIPKTSGENMIIGLKYNISQQNFDVKNNNDLKGKHCRRSESVPSKNTKLIEPKPYITAIPKHPIGIKSARFGLPMITEPSEVEKLVFNSEYKRDPHFLLKYGNRTVDFNSHKINIQKIKQMEIKEKRERVRNLRRERLIQSQVANYINHIKQEQKRKAYEFNGQVPIVIDSELPLVNLKTSRKSFGPLDYNTLVDYYFPDEEKDIPLSQMYTKTAKKRKIRSLKKKRKTRQKLLKSLGINHKIYSE